MIARGVGIFLACTLLQIQAAVAADPAADFLTKLFTDVCVPNMGRPDKVRAWANEKRLQAVTNPAALHVFVGQGDKGGAWAVPAQAGNFALAIRGTTEGCAVWAQAAHVGEVANNFKKIMEGVKRPGLKVSVASDQTNPTAFGQVRALVYSVFPDNGRRGFGFTMLTAERAGGPYQASLQVAAASAP